VQFAVKVAVYLHVSGQILRGVRTKRPHERRAVRRHAEEAAGAAVIGEGGHRRVAPRQPSPSSQGVEHGAPATASA
jgi:hypothetical protein